MKNQNIKKLTFWTILISTMISSTVYLLVHQNLWREISEREAQKISLKIPSWAPLVERAQPAVVVISTEAEIEQAPMEFPGQFGPFRYFLPVPPERQRGQGSGFIINEDGYVLTNQHVIDGAQKIKIVVGLDAREYDAEVIGADEPLDIALLKIKTEEKEKIKWPFLPLGNSDKLRLGDPVLALGSPLGLVQSVNAGIVAHKHRGNIKPSGRELFTYVIQLDISMNPGNSGGPVLNDSGETMCMGESIMASGQNIAFCLPINPIKNVIPQLLAKGKIERAFLGVEPDDLTPQYAKELGLSQNQKGAILKQVYPNTPASKAGLKPMDVILEIDGQTVMDAFNLRQETAYRGIGQTVTLKIFRKGEGVKTVKVKLEKRPGEVSQIVRPNGERNDTVSIEGVGLEVTDTPEQVRHELGLSDGNAGAQVVNVMRRPGLLAALTPGDVITRVDGIPITSAKQLKNLIDSARKDKTFMMLIRRGTTELFMPLVKR